MSPASICSLAQSPVLLPVDDHLFLIFNASRSESVNLTCVAPLLVFPQHTRTHLTVRGGGLSERSLNTGSSRVSTSCRSDSHRHRHLREPTPPLTLTDGKRRPPCTCWQRRAGGRKKTFSHKQKVKVNKGQSCREQTLHRDQATFRAFLCGFFRFSNGGNDFSSCFPTDFSQCIHTIFHFSLIEFRPLTHLFKPTTEFILHYFLVLLFT